MPNKRLLLLLWSTLPLGEVMYIPPTPTLFLEPSIHLYDRNSHISIYIKPHLPPLGKEHPRKNYILVFFIFQSNSSPMLIKVLNKCSVKTELVSKDPIWVMRKKKLSPGRTKRSKRTQRGKRNPSLFPSFLVWESGRSCNCYPFLQQIDVANIL